MTEAERQEWLADLTEAMGAPCGDGIGEIRGPVPGWGRSA